MAKLISYTQPSSELYDNGIDSPEELIAFCARVSNPANQFNTETSTRLVKYLIKHKHWSPLDMVDITVEFDPTRDIGRQILRHQSFKFQESVNGILMLKIWEICLYYLNVDYKIQPIGRIR